MNCPYTLLYRKRIIHKDIKPANILINPETKKVKPLTRKIMPC